MKKFLLTLCCVLTTMFSYAYDFEVDGFYYTITSVSDLTVVLASGHNISYEKSFYPSTTIIPETVEYNGKMFTVTGLGSFCMAGAYNYGTIKDYTKIVIPNTVKYIGADAFIYTNIAELYLGKNVEEFKSSSLSHCCIDKLYIEDLSAFCRIKYPTLYEYDMPSWEGGSKQGDLYLNGSRITNLSLPTDLTQINAYNFFYVTSLEVVNIHSNIEKIERNAFTNCKNLTTVNIADGLKSIAYGAFRKCPKLEKVNIPESVTVIESGAFTETGLRTFTFPNSIKNVEMGAISGSELQKVTIGNDVSSIKGNAKGDTLVVNTLVPPTIPESFFTESQKMNYVVLVPKEALSAYKEANYWKEIWNLKSNDGNTETEEKEECEKPIISIDNNNLIVSCPTEGAVIHTSISVADAMTVDTPSGEAISLSGQYVVKSYATTNNKLPSKISEALLVWVNPEIQTSSSNTISMNTRKAIVIKNDGLGLNIQGTEIGESISVYSMSGMLIINTKSSDGCTNIPCNLNPGDVYLIKYDNQTIKYIAR